MEQSLTSIGKIGLEGLMDRANIAFTSGYRFKGSINPSHLQQSITAVCQAIDKFSYQVNFISQDNFSWQQGQQANFSLQQVYTKNLEHAFTDVCQQSHITFTAQHNVPMVFTLIQHSNASAEPDSEFIIAQTSCHTHVDARSAEVIFNKVAAHYNALMQQDLQTAKTVVDSAKQLSTIDADIIIKQRFKGPLNALHDNNITELSSYSVEDVGEHGIAMSTLDNKLAHYKTTQRKPITQYFDVDKLLACARKKYSDISRNSIICAAIVKAIYEINITQRGAEKSHNISFKMLSDFLTAKERQAYTGNYIAFVPVTVSGEKPLIDIAKDINDRIVHFKTSKLDVSVFALTEEAIQAALVGSADEPLSFIVTNWHNFTFTEQADFLTGCQSIRHQSGVNIEPKDNLGAALVNRPVFVINFSPNGELCLSQFPSLDTHEVNKNLATYFNHIFLGFG